MAHKIKIDVTSAVGDFYPGLSYSQVDSIAKSIKEEWDYSGIYDEIHDRIQDYCEQNCIDLTDKEEPQIPPDLRLVK